MYRDPDFGPVVPERAWVPAPRYLLRRDRVLAWLRRAPRGRLLEIGCGSGALLRELAELGYECTAVETSPAARELAGYVLREFRGVPIHADLGELSQNDFDYLLALEVLEHIEDDVATLRRWASYLRPGGTLLVSVPAHPSRWNARDEWAGHVRRYTRGRLLQAVTEAGFHLLRLECYGFPLANLLEPLAARHYRQAGSAEPRVGNSDRKSRTARSGVDRETETRAFGLLASPPGRLAMRASFLLQRATLRLPWGNGWFLVARARNPLD